MLGSFHVVARLEQLRLGSIISFPLELSPSRNRLMSGYGLTAANIRGFRRASVSGPNSCPLEFPSRANCGCEQVQQELRYSITSSEATSRPGGTVRPSAFAVLRLRRVSYLTGVCTGRSAGLAPRR